MSASSRPTSRRTWSTHDSRLARWAHNETTMGYQRALAAVKALHAAGRLPARLDAEGMDLALRHVLQQDVLFDVRGRPVSLCHQVYPSLTAMLLVPVDPGAVTAAGLARAAGVRPALAHGEFDPSTLLDRNDTDEDDLDVDEPSGIAVEPWTAVVLDAGPRTEYELPLISSVEPGGDLRVDRALDHLRATDDVKGYRALLLDAVEQDPTDVDAYAHLGLVALQQRDAFYALDLPGTGERQELLDEALTWFTSAVLVGEQALDVVFTGTLPGARLGNRPFLRALHGLALTLWRQDRFLGAEKVLVVMLWLDPEDRFGAAELLDLARRRVGWHPGFTTEVRLRHDALVRARRPVQVVPGSLRELLVPRGTAPSAATVAAVLRRAAAVALGGAREEQYILLPSGVRVRVVTRHARGHDLTPCVYWWDAHTTAAVNVDEPWLFVLVGDTGRILLTRLLRPAELRHYRAAALPRRDRTAFTTTFTHHGTEYGVDLTSAVDAALDRPARPTD